MNDTKSNKCVLVLPSSHPLSLSVCSQQNVDELCLSLPTGVTHCQLISPGLVKLSLQVMHGGYSSRVWSFMVGGAGIGDDESFVLQFGGSSRSPLSARFQQPLSMYGVDDAGFVDATFWNCIPSNKPPTLRIIAERAVQWLSGPVDDLEGKVLWSQAEQHYVNKRIVMDTYVPQCPELFHSGTAKDTHATLRREWLAPGLARILFATVEGNNQQRMSSPPTAQALLEAASVFQLTNTESGGIYSFNLFTETFCELLEAEIEAFKRSGLPCRRPNTMNKGGLVVNDIGIESLMTDLLNTIIAPLAEAIYPREIFVTSLDHHHSFVVAYDAKGGDKGLDMHHDASEITLNVCLSDGFTGAGLRFCGEFGSIDHRITSTVATHQKGRAILHLGRQRHGADDLTSGSRLNLIVWARSSAFRGAAAYGHIPPDGYPKATESSLSPPDLLCLSKSNDDDYNEQLKRFQKVDEAGMNVVSMDLPLGQRKRTAF